MTGYDIQRLIPDLLQAIPEIREGYNALKEEFSGPLPEYDLEELEIIREMHGFPIEDPDEPGITIVIENIVVPYIIELVNSKNTKRLQEIMAFMERWASSEIFDISNLVGVCICEPLITTYEDYIEDTYPYMGPATIKMCIDSFSAFRVSDKTKQIFGILPK